MADDTTFFLSNGNSGSEAKQIFEHFSNLSELKPNKSKCEIAAIGVLKRGPNSAMCYGICTPEN